MSKNLGPIPRISAEAPRYPWPRTEAELITVRRATLAANEGREFPCPHGHGPMAPRPLERQTYEQLFCGLWWDCQRCGSGSSIPSRELAVHLGEPHRTDGGGWEKYDGAAWVVIGEAEAESFWAARQAWRDERERQMVRSARQRKRAPAVAK